MANEAEEIIRKWQHNVPPNVPKKDVEIVVEANFPGLHRYHQKGSHWLIVSDPELRQAEEAGFNTGTQGGVISLSLVGGKTVKGVYGQNLLDAIEIKRQLKHIKEELEKEQRGKR